MRVTESTEPRRCAECGADVGERAVTVVSVAGWSSKVICENCAARRIYGLPPTTTRLQGLRRFVIFRLFRSMPREEQRYMMHKLAARMKKEGA